MINIQNITLKFKFQKYKDYTHIWKENNSSFNNIRIILIFWVGGGGGVVNHMNN